MVEVRAGETKGATIAGKIMARRPRSSPQSSQRDFRLEMKTRGPRGARSKAAISVVMDHPLSHHRVRELAQEEGSR
jgi:hypothetical protein